MKLKRNARRTHKVNPATQRLAHGEPDLYVRKRCIAKARSGERCKSAPMRGKKKCMFHTGNFARTLGSKGGHRRAIFNPDELKEFSAPKSASDLKDLLAQSLVDVRRGNLDPRVANSISCLGAGFVKAIEISDLEARLTALERPRNGDQG
jgi:hypothetical protein